MGKIHLHGRFKYTLDYTLGDNSCVLGHYSSDELFTLRRSKWLTSEEMQLFKKTKNKVEIPEHAPLSGWFRIISFLWASLILFLLAGGLNTAQLVTGLMLPVLGDNQLILVWGIILTYLTPKIRAASLLFILGSNPPL